MIACCWFGVSQSTGSSSMIPRSSAKAAVASSARPTVRSWSTIHQASLSVTRIPAIWATHRTLRTMVIGASRRVEPASEPHCDGTPLARARPSAWTEWPCRSSKRIRPLRSVRSAGRHRRSTPRHPRRASDPQLTHPQHRGPRRLTRTVGMDALADIGPGPSRRPRTTGSGSCIVHCADRGDQPEEPANAATPPGLCGSEPQSALRRYRAA